jgi:hypothetical protein
MVAVCHVVPRLPSAVPPQTEVVPGSGSDTSVRLQLPSAMPAPQLAVALVEASETPP